MKLQVAVSRASLIFQKRFPDAVDTLGMPYTTSTACTRSHEATTEQKLKTVAKGCDSYFQIDDNGYLGFNNVDIAVLADDLAPDLYAMDKPHIYYRETMESSLLFVSNYANIHMHYAASFRGCKDDSVRLKMDIYLLKT